MVCDNRLWVKGKVSPKSGDTLCIRGFGKELCWPRAEIRKTGRRWNVG